MATAMSDGWVEALKGVHAEALGSKAVLLEVDRLAFPILPIGTLCGRFRRRPPCLLGEQSVPLGTAPLQRRNFPKQLSGKGQAAATA
jgi:hypothetical protein